MALEMRERCERCETAELPPDAPARICSYECTFCVPTTAPKRRRGGRGVA
ncbi:DUF1272 domain-containing protein [Streptomyces sp. S3(2020)]|nr:DUF1272 domain-containing protein [Streptomyces sp. S3(2020)]